jgi:hypothetical protein
LWSKTRLTSRCHPCHQWQQHQHFLTGDFAFPWTGHDFSRENVTI